MNCSMTKCMQPSNLIAIQIKLTKYSLTLLEGKKKETRTEFNSVLPTGTTLTIIITDILNLKPKSL